MFLDLILIVRNQTKTELPVADLKNSNHFRSMNEKNKKESLR